MHRHDLVKPDGRLLALYSRRPFDAGAQAPSPFAEPLAAAPHLRWHPLRGEWVTYAAYRQGRTFLPPPRYDPLAPTTDPSAPTEVPAGDWEIAVFDNRFPSLRFAPSDATAPPAIVATRPAHGHCEVLVYGQDQQTPLGALPLDRIELLFEVLADRYALLAARGDLACMLPFENRGAEVGVTLHHPHAQIYAYSTLPPVPARLQQQAVEHLQRHGSGLLQDLIAGEIADGRRLLYRGPRVVAFVPVCARYPYEVWVAPVDPLADFAALDDATRADLARALKTVLMKLDGLWQRPMPYLMAWYAAPFEPGARAAAHLHAQIWPPYRSRDRLKYLAGTELAAGLFAMDALPEDGARELQAVVVEVDR